MRSSISKNDVTCNHMRYMLDSELFFQLDKKLDCRKIEGVLDAKIDIRLEDEFHNIKAQLDQLTR